MPLMYEVVFALAKGVIAFNLVMAVICVWIIVRDAISKRDRDLLRGDPNA